MFTLTFWRAAGERAIRAFAFALSGAIGVGAVGFGDINWIAALSASGVAALLSVLTSVIVNSTTGTGPAISDSEQTVAKDEIVVPIEVFATNQ